LPEPEPQEPELQALEDEILPGVYDALEPGFLEPEETTYELQDIVLPDDFEILREPVTDQIPEKTEPTQAQEPVFSILEDQKPVISVIERPEPPTPLAPEPEPEPSTASKKLDEPKQPLLRFSINP
jgi:hypothetical protein